MYKLTTGDLRYIAQATTPWKMTIDTVLTKMEAIPDVVKERIENLTEKYKEELGEFYLKALNEDEDRLVDSILFEFDNQWDKDHPEYYDIDLLIKECSKKDKENAKDAIESVKAIFTQN